MNTTPLSASWHSEDAQCTRAIGSMIAPHLYGGMVVGLSGPLGSGKTTLVAGILTGLKMELIASPSFQLICEYYNNNVHLYHIDCYRLKHIDELENIAWRDFTGEDSIVLIEWYDRFPELSLEQNIDIAVESNGQRHIVAKGIISR